MDEEKKTIRTEKKLSEQEAAWLLLNSLVSTLSLDTKIRFAVYHHNYFF